VLTAHAAQAVVLPKPYVPGAHVRQADEMASNMYVPAPQHASAPPPVQRE
jgi:hypothetical protein